MLRLLLTVVTLIIGSQYSMADQNSYSFDSLTSFTDEMQSIYGVRASYTLSVSVKKSVATVEFCPDSPCETVTATKYTSLRELYDFFYLFEYIAPGDYDLYVTWKKRKSVGQNVQYLVQLYAKESKCDLSTNAGICVLNYLTDKLGVQVGLVRFDEGEIIREVLDIQEVIRVRAEYESTLK